MINSCKVSELLHTLIYSRENNLLPKTTSIFVKTMTLFFYEFLSGLDQHVH